MRLSVCAAVLLCLRPGWVAAGDDTPRGPGDNEPVFICPLPRCDGCPSKDRLVAPGVGFALEMGYGTASIRHNDGSFEHVARVNGSPSYLALMRDLATGPINRMTDGSRTPPGVDERDWTTMPRWALFHARRQWNKLLGRPATPEVGVLADMVAELRLEVEGRLGRRVVAAALSAPDRVRLTWQEVGDLFDHLGMEDLVADKMNPLFGELFSMAAAEAGYGLGLCSNYTDAYECAKEEQFAPLVWGLQLDFGEQALSAAMEQFRTARRSYAHLTLVDVVLGRGRIPPEPSNAAVYWREVETRIREFVGSRRPEAVFLTGESASEPQFVRVVRDALSRMDGQPIAGLEWDETAAAADTATGFLFATSKGAAEFAKRRQEGMARCWLPPECRGRKGADRDSEDRQEL